MRSINEKTKVWVLAWPIFLEFFLNVLINNVDTMMLSGVSENAVGSVGNANLVLNFVNVLFQIIGVATSVMVSQYMGAEKSKHEINTVYSVAFFANLFFGMTLSAVLFIGAEPILSVMHVKPEMLDDAKAYMMVVGGTIFLQACFNVMVAIMRCNGLQIFGMLTALCANVINFFGNYAFLYGIFAEHKFGALGVAISTAGSRFIAVTILLIIFAAKKIGKISLSYFNPFPKKILKTLLKVGLPSAGESANYNLYQLVLLSLVNYMSAESVEARVYCSMLMSFSGIFAFAVANATQVLVGYLIGSGREDEAGRRVKKYLKICLPIACGIATLNWAVSPFTVHFFTSNPDTVAIVQKVMAVCIFLEIGRCMNMLVINSMKAAGDFKFPFFLGLVTMWGAGLGFGALCGLGFGWGLPGIFMGTASDEFIRGVVVTIRWYKGKWRNKAIARKSTVE